MSAPRILAFAGSTRRDSYNKKLVKIAAGAAQQAGAKVTVVDLADFSMPLFDEDLEKSTGASAAVTGFKKYLLEHDGFLISSPEYNSSITGVLKNAIDWASRPAAGEEPLACFKGKTAVLMSASPGALGGLRGLVVLRMLLGNIGVTVLPDQVAVSRAQEAFDAEMPRLKDARQQGAIENLGKILVFHLNKILAKSN